MNTLENENTLPVHRSILGKTMPKNYPLINHLIDTGAVAEALWEHTISDLTKASILNGIRDNEEETINAETVRSLVIYAAGMHDIGKATPHWQRRVLNLSKEHYSFQNCLDVPEEAQEGMGVHQKNSAIYFTHVNQKTSTLLGDLPVNEGIATCLHGHHGLYESFSANEAAKIIHGIRVPAWEEAQQNIERDIMDIFGITSATFEDIETWDTPSIILATGIIILSDWIASRSEFINSQRNYDSPQEHYKNAQRLAQDFIQGWGIGRAEWEEDLSWNAIYPDYTYPSPFQQSIINAVESKTISGAGILMISAPMGAGKTETALYAGSNLAKELGASGLWMNLPTQATSDAMFPRAVQIADRVFKGDDHSVALLHSNASISQAIESVTRKNYHLGSDAVSEKDQILDGDMCSEHPQEDTNLFISEFLIERRLGGMSNITVGTVDQMIKATTRMKHNQLRWLSVSGNVVLLDEIHDFDPYTFSLIKKHVAWCGALGVPVIAISATLSGESQRELVQAYWSGRDYGVSKKTKTRYIESAIPLEGIGSPAWFFAPLEPDYIHRNEEIPDEIYPEYTTHIKTVNSFTSYAKKIVNTVVNENNGQALVVCNTVDQAVAMYELLEGEGYDSKLLHSRMPQEEKSRIVNEILSASGKPKEGVERKPYVLVSTQIVQQSMDIDFDVLISSFAPLDETLQRVGRVHRHNQKGNRSPVYENSPEIYLLVPQVLPEILEQGNDDEFIAGIIPYTKWEQMSSYITLKNLSSCDTWKWDAKGDIQRVYRMYAELYSQASNQSLNNPFLGAAYEEFYTDRHMMEVKANSPAVSINMPLADDIVGFTADYSSRREDAPQTRLIEDSAVVLPLWEKNGHWYMDSSHNHPVKDDCDLDMLRSIGLRSINITQSFLKEIDIPETMTMIINNELANKFPPYITLVHGPRTGNKVKMDDTLGLVRTRSGFATWL